VADRDLNDAIAPGLSADRRLSIAYSATLQCAAAALAVAGYRTVGESHHYRLLQSLAHTVGAERALVDQLDQTRRKRNVAEYERAGMVSDHEVVAVCALARRLRTDIEDWIRRTRPDLF
jgi:hypothetical protein